MAKITKDQVEITRPVDRTDPGFRIKGVRLRWLSADVSEIRYGRIWRVLRKEDMPKELIDHIESVNPGAFRDGNTIKRKGLFLGWAPEEEALKYRRELDQAAYEQRNAVDRMVAEIPKASTTSDVGRLEMPTSPKPKGQQQNGADRFRN